MNPSMDWHIGQLVAETRIARATLGSSRFLTGITGPLLKIVDDMFEWFDDHRDLMDDDTRFTYLLEIGKIQADIGFYQKIAKNLWGEDSNA